MMNAITKGGGSTRPLGVLEEHLIESLKADAEGWGNNED